MKPGIALTVLFALSATPSGRVDVPAESPTVGFISTVAGRLEDFPSCGSLPFVLGLYNGDGGPAANATLCHPDGLTVDAADNLYVADFSANRVRRISADSGIMTTVAGTGSAGFAGDG